MNNKRRLMILVKVIAASVALLGVIVVLDKDDGKKDGAYTADGYYLYDFVMGTSASYRLYGDEKIAEKAAADINDAIKTLDEGLISWRSKESELCRLNSDYEAFAPYRLSDGLATVIAKALKLCESSDGALDITIRPLAALWGIEEKTEEEFTVPGEEDISSVLDDIGYDNVHLNGNTITIDNGAVMLDLGAVGKGYALDYAKEILDDYSGLSGAIISVGGSVLVMGGKPDGKPWRIGIRNPKGAMNEMLCYIEILSGSSMCISTSGNYEKYIQKDGVMYHHILDSVTGYPVDTELTSVTVVCEDGLYSDGLSTACYVLGYEKSKPLLDAYNAEAIFIDKNNEVTVYGNLKIIIGE